MLNFIPASQRHQTLQQAFTNAGARAFVVIVLLFLNLTRSVHGFSLSKSSLKAAQPPCLRLASSSSSSVVVGKEPAALHIVQGIECLEVKIQLPVVGEMTILEATANAQEVLVNLALEDDTTTTTVSDTTRLSHSDPYGAVLWPAATAVSRTMLENPAAWLNNKRVLELGTGTGLVSLAAAAGGAVHVTATDYEPLALHLLDHAAQRLNPAVQESSCRLTTQLLDLCRFNRNDGNYVPLPVDVDVVVAADVMYEPKTGRALAHRVVEALQSGAHILIGDSPGRAGRPAFLQELQALGVRGNAKFVETPGWTVMGDRHDLICGQTSTSVSKDKEKPQPLMVALMELDPKVHCPSPK